MKSKTASRSAFFSPRALIGLGFCSIGLFIALLAFALYPGGNAFAEQNKSVPLGIAQQNVPVLQATMTQEPPSAPGVSITSLEDDGIVDMAALRIYPTEVPVTRRGTPSSPDGAAVGTGKAFLGISHEIVNQNTTGAFGTLSSGWTPGESVQLYLNGSLAGTYSASANGTLAVGINTNAGFGYIRVEENGLTSLKETGGVVHVAATGPYLPGVTAAPHAVNTSTATAPLLLYGWGYPASTLVNLYRNGVSLGTTTTNASGRYFVSVTPANNGNTSAVYSSDRTGIAGSMAARSIEERSDAGTPPVGDQNVSRAFIDRAGLDSAVGGKFLLVGEGFLPGEPITLSGCAALSGTADANGATNWILTAPAGTGVRSCVQTGGTSGRSARASVLSHANVTNLRGLIVSPASVTPGGTVRVMADKLPASNTGNIYLDGVLKGSATTNASGTGFFTLTKPTTGFVHAVSWIATSGTGDAQSAVLLLLPNAAPTPTPNPAAQAINLSTRMRVQTGDNVGVGGFIITGNAPKRVLLRGIGPSLTGFGVPDALADPVMELNGPAGFATITNDNWKDTQQAEIQATGIPPTNDLESAILATLNPGAYTAIVSGKNNTSGVALIEAYDLNQAVAAKLGNISTRAFVSTGANAVIAGFILGNGAGMDNMIVRGIGPSLAAAGVPNALADPTLELRDTNGALLISNDNWQDDPAQAAQLSAHGLAPQNSLESGIFVSLPPSTFTTILAGKNGGTGIGLVEIYSSGVSSCAPPMSATGVATNLSGGSSATLNGTVNPNGYNTTVYFRYGTTTSYGSTTGNQVFAGTTTLNVSSTINGLTPGTTYHFQIVATNCGGVSYGIDRTFIPGTTGCYLPAVQTSEATDVADTCATLHGTVNPQGLATTVHFEYDNGSNHFSTPNQAFNGNTVQNVSASISGLTPGAFSSFVLVATNQCGTSTSVGGESFCPSPWDGTWTGTIPNLACGTGNTTFTMTISKNGNNVSGNASWDNIPCFSGGQCVGVVNNSSGTVSGSISSCSTIQIHYTGTASGCGCSCDGQTVQFELTGTRNGRVISFNESGYQFHFTKTSPPPTCSIPWRFPKPTEDPILATLFARACVRTRDLPSSIIIDSL